MNKLALNPRLLSLKPLVKEIHEAGSTLKRFGKSVQHKYKPKVSNDNTLKGFHYSQVLVPKKRKIFKTPVSTLKAELGHELGHIKNLKARVGTKMQDSPVTKRLISKRKTPLTVQSEHQANLTGLSELKRLNLITNPQESKKVTKILSRSQNHYDFLNKAQEEHIKGRSKPISALKAFKEVFKKNRY